MTRAATHPASPVPPPPAEVTYEEFMAMPVTKQPTEVIDGVIHVMPMPTYRHQRIQGKLGRPLEDHVEREALGFVLATPMDVVIRKVPKLRVRQPDLAFFSDAKAGFRIADNLDSIEHGMLRPQIAVEILSPGQNERTLADKLADYAFIEVDEVWFVDQDTKSIRVLAREGDGYRLAVEYGVGNRLVSAVLPGLDLDVAAIFA